MIPSLTFGKTQIDRKTNKKIQIISDSTTNIYIRIEEDNDKTHFMAHKFMAANYIYVIIPKENMHCIDEYTIHLNMHLREGEYIRITESNCPRIYELHMYPPDKICLFDRVWNLSQQLNLAPFPEYIHML
jgi:hypothetical protein